MTGPERALPYSAEAERAILGAWMLDNNLTARISVQAGDFFSPGRRRIFEAMVRLDAAQRPMDAVTVGVELGGRLPSVGGASYVSEFQRLPGLEMHRAPLHFG